MILNFANVCFFLVKEECVSEDEEEEVKDNLVEEILQQGDTAIIYPEAPEDEQSPAETGGADENGNICTQNTTAQCFCCAYLCFIAVFFILLSERPHITTN